MEPFLQMVRLFMEPPFSQPIDRAILSAQVPEALRAAVREIIEEQSRVHQPPARVLSRPGGRRPWFRDWDTTAGYYWPRQRRYLIQLGRTTAELGSLDNATDLTLAHLEDPRHEGPRSFRVQGL